MARKRKRETSVKRQLCYISSKQKAEGEEKAFSSVVLICIQCSCLQIGLFHHASGFAKSVRKLFFLCPCPFLLTTLMNKTRVMSISV